MAEEEVKLFGMWSSSYNQRVELALKLKGIQYDYIEEDLSNKSQLLLKYSPIYQKIPVLVHNGRPIAESLVILEYIDETWKDNSVLPKDPHDSAKARFWAKFIDEKLQPAAVKANMEGGEKAIEESHELLKMLENELQGKDFFGGESIGYLDIVAMVLAFWYPLVEQVVGLKLFSEEKFPLLYKWISKLQEVDIVNECRPPRVKHLDY